jgi:hypothetical protein
VEKTIKKTTSPFGLANQKHREIATATVPRVRAKQNVVLPIVKINFTKLSLFPETPEVLLVGVGNSAYFTHFSRDNWCIFTPLKCRITPHILHLTVEEQDLFIGLFTLHMA